ncbi:hypothetical protein HHK36_023739 [Tetracentron sinense]|uniref:Uncharacterized protein n=1 Tax=Tetracentron sinense TaxID=13715 RepID=A0A834YLW6_TETSI|nr:hypothetical protein HHK36_023739 [Tetracentron sinense]
MVRTPCCEKTGIRKGAWTAEEDQKLTSYIRKYGHWNWRELPKYAGKKNPTAPEPKLHSDETPLCETKEKRELEPSNSLPDDPKHQIIESSFSSPQPSSSEFSSLSSDSAFLSGTNWIAEDNMGSSDFWTEPYLAGNSYIQEDFPATLFEHEFLFPFSSVSQYGSYDGDGMHGLK